MRIVKPLSESEARSICKADGVEEDLPYKDGIKNFTDDTPNDKDTYASLQLIISLRSIPCNAYVYDITSLYLPLALLLNFWSASLSGA